MVNPAKASRDNLDGLGHVTSRMNWYCGMTDHLLDEKYMDIVGDRSYDGILRELKGRIVDMYKQLLLYQMKSVCAYYGNQGWRWVRNLINLDAWGCSAGRDYSCREGR